MPGKLSCLFLVVSILWGGSVTIFQQTTPSVPSATSLPSIVGQKVTIKGTLSIAIIDPTRTAMGILGPAEIIYHLNTNNGRILLKIPEGMTIPSLPDGCAIISGNWEPRSGSPEREVEVLKIQQC